MGKNAGVFDHAASVVPLFKGNFRLAENSCGTNLRQRELSTGVTDAFIANLPLKPTRRKPLTMYGQFRIN